MAYSFGGGVNAQLGAVDYSPFLRGSLQGSQMAAQGAAMQGQAIGQAGGMIGNAIIQAAQQYQAKKEAKAKEDEAVTFATGLITKNPEFAKALGIKDAQSPDGQKALRAIAKQIEPEKLMAFGMQLEQQQKEQQAIAEAMSVQAPWRPGEGMKKSYGSTPATATQFIQQGAGKVNPNTLANLGNAMTNAQRQPDAGKAVDPRSFRATDEQGNPIERTVDMRTGRIIAEGPVNQPTSPKRTPEEEARAAELTARAKASFDINQSIVNAAQDAQSQIRDLDQAIALIDSGVETGFGEDTLLKGKQLLKRFGVEIEGVPQAEQLRVLLGNQVMQRVADTKGAISNFEMQKFTEYSANFGNSPEGNKLILQFAKQARERTLDLAKKIRGWRESGDSEAVIEAKVQDFQEDNPLPILKKLDQESGIPKAASEAGVTPAVWNAMTAAEKALFQ